MPDGTVFGPGARIDKVWRLRNSGDCPWMSGYQIAFFSGDQMGAADVQDVPPTAPGATADIAVTMYAPEAPGTYTGHWRIMDASGQIFGPDVYVQIAVTAHGIPTATPFTLVMTPPATQVPTGVPATPKPTERPKPKLSGVIAYTEFNTAYPQRTYDLYVANADGTDRRLLVQYARQPDFRSDGRLIYNGDGGGKSDLWVINVDGSDDRQVTNHPEDSHPTWSAMDGRFAFDSTQLKVDQAGRRASMIFVQDDTRTRPPADPRLLLWGSYRMFGNFPVWLADDHLVFKGCNYWAGGGNCGLFKVPSWGDAEPIRLTADPSDMATDAYGNSVLFMSHRDGNWEVYIMDTNGAGQRNLTHNPTDDGLATFSPDGRMIAFVSDRDGRWAIWAMNVDGSGLQKLFDMEKGYGNEPGYEWTEERISWGP